jgi:hypothetical protein
MLQVNIDPIKTGFTNDFCIEGRSTVEPTTMGGLAIL